MKVLTIKYSRNPECFSVIPLSIVVIDMYENRAEVGSFDAFHVVSREIGLKIIDAQRNNENIEVTV